MKQWAIIKDGIVVNVCMWDGETPYTPPDGCVLAQSDTCGIGDVYDHLTQAFSKPEGA